MHPLGKGALTLRTSGWELVSRRLRAFAEPDGPKSSVRLIPSERRQDEPHHESSTRHEDAAPQREI